ncbi:hypothetical protein DSM21852_04300 [Methylocystis bryophila]|nr:hypothetical protein DSM21852_04300 [Methylocystis bryophila]
MTAAIERRKSVPRNIAVHVANWRPVEIAKLSVDLARERFQLMANIGVSLDLLARRRRDLHQGDGLTVLRMKLQQALEGTEPVRQTLRVVEAIHPDDVDARLAASMQPLDPPFGLGMLRHCGERIDANAGWKHARPDNTPPDAHDVRREHFTAHRLAQEAAKIRLVGPRLKTHDVIGEHRLHEPFVLRHRYEHVRRRERNVQEEADAIFDLARAELRGEGDQMIVVNPDEIVEV